MGDLSRTYAAGKRAMDVAGAFLGLLCLAAVFLPIALAVKLTSRGPVFFRQTRLTLGGRPFTFYKFRTMSIGQELSVQEMDRINEMGGPHFKSRFDPRITWFGKILRKFSLDEWPQFYNVFKGDMSLVGPRPPLKHEADQYSPRERRRLSVKSGLTGLWQISGRSRLTFAEMIDLDLRYAEGASLWLDLKILLRTLPAVLTGRGAW